MIVSRFDTREEGKAFLDSSGYGDRFGDTLLFINISGPMAGSFGCEPGWYAWNRVSKQIQLFEERPAFSVPPQAFLGCRPSRRLA